MQRGRSAENLRNISVGKKIGFVFLIFFVLNSIAYFVVTRFIADQQSDGMIINISGSQRMLIEKMYREAIMIAGGNDGQKQHLKQTIDQFTQIQNELYPKTRLSGVRPLLRDGRQTHSETTADSLWENMRNYSSRLIEAEQQVDIDSAMSGIRNTYPSFLQEVDRSVSIFEQILRLKVRILKFVQLSILIANLVTLSFGLWATYRYIVNPISQVISRMSKVSKGQLRLELLPVDRRDEIGQLYEAFNTMVGNLQLRKELILTGDIQKNMLPPDLRTDRLTIRSVYQPAQYVSGDMFDYSWETQSDKLSGYMIDIMGHGLATALQLSAVRVLFRQAAHMEHPLCQKLFWINNEATKTFTDETFAAVICFELDLSARKMVCVSGGINHFLILRRNRLEKVKVSGVFVGMLENETFDQHEVHYSPGDAFFFLSDGLLDLLPESMFQGCLEFLEAIERLTALTRNAANRDDATALCIRLDL